MLLLILLVLFYVVVDQKSIILNVDELLADYKKNTNTANNKYLNKHIELAGKVQSYYKFEDGNNLLQLQTEKDLLEIYCILMNKELKDKAITLTTGSKVTIYGKCLGFNPSKKMKFPNSIYIETENLK